VIVGNHDFDLGLTFLVHGGWDGDLFGEACTQVDRGGTLV
jgi:hypothetical protein